ncbi:hypothetical protein B0H12DRAFT_1071432 [Mycena haematopus]|nr:hypothetical protein B0H12DRAFT_1071432 [Mycena haematopus]
MAVQFKYYYSESDTSDDRLGVIRVVLHDITTEVHALILLNEAIQVDQEIRFYPTVQLRLNIILGACLQVAINIVHDTWFAKPPNQSRDQMEMGLTRSHSVRVVHFTTSQVHAPSIHPFVRSFMLPVHLIIRTNPRLIKFEIVFVPRFNLVALRRRIQLNKTREIKFKCDRLRFLPRFEFNVPDSQTLIEDPFAGTEVRCARRKAAVSSSTVGKPKGGFCGEELDMKA